MTYFAKPALAIAFGALFLCAETCLHADSVLHFASRPLQLPVHDWAAGGVLLVAGILAHRDSSTRRRQYQAVGWALMLSLLFGAWFETLGEWLTPPDETGWLSEGAFVAIVGAMTIIALCGLVGTLKMGNSR